MEYFKLPFAGYRDYGSASLDSQGSYSYYWSSSPESASSNNARNLFLYLTYISASDRCYHSNGISIRCFKNTYEAPTTTYTLELHANSGVVAEDTLETDSE